MDQDAEHHYGFKKLTRQNWREPDRVLRVFCKRLPDGSIKAVSEDDYADMFLDPVLFTTVPVDVRALYEAARGVLLYGYFFYPLYALGSYQLYRVAEAAAKAKCTALGAPAPKIKTFERTIRYLHKNGILDNDELNRWEAIRSLRNIGSHLDSQDIFTPGDAARALYTLAEFINRIFSQRNEQVRQPDIGNDCKPTDWPPVPTEDQRKGGRHD